MHSEDLSDVLSEFARTMLTDFPIQDILDHLVRRIVEIMPITAAGVTLISPTLEPRYIAASNRAALRFEQLQSALREGPCLAAYQSGEFVSVPDLRHDQRFPSFSPRALASGLSAVFTFPLRHREVQHGALDLYRNAPGPLSISETRSAQTLADVAAAYLINAQARADLLDASEQSREAALHDPLTELPNRTLLLERLKHALLREGRSGTTSAVLFIDLNNFKAINDAFGHQIGDELLVAVARRLATVLRPGDTLARLSGDEFVVLCEDIGEPSHVAAIAERAHAAVAGPFVLAGVEVPITASIGIASSGRDETPAQLLHDADRAMYQTKRRDAVGERRLDLSARNLDEHHAGLAAALPGAERRGELYLHYQPIVTAREGRMTGMEALLRWTHPNRGTVPAKVFIPFAEQSGVIVEIGRWALDQACRDRRRIQSRRSDPLLLFVNVSLRQLMSAGFVSDVASALTTSSTDPSLLILEVTESLFLGDYARAQIVFDALKRLGVSLALDDFGTGYSSISRLRRLPIDIVKIEQEFISYLSHEPPGHPIVTSIIELAHGLGSTVVAEGVETAEQHQILIELGCDFCQGYYFARPMAAAGIGTLGQRQLNPGRAARAG